VKAVFARVVSVLPKPANEPENPISEKALDAIGS